MKKRGRPSKPYRLADGSYVDGLRRKTDGRWHVVATGAEFTEKDERLAVQRFRAMFPSASVFVGVSRSMDLADNAAAADTLGGIGEVVQVDHADGSNEIGYSLDSKAAWNWFREQLINHPLHAARMTGIPQLADFAHLAIPKPSLKLAALLKLYSDNSDASAESKRSAAATFNWFMEETGATTLEDLTQERLMEFRKKVIADGVIKSSGTFALYFGRIKWIIRFALRMGKDAEQINAALARLAVLYTPKSNVKANPQPISAADFKTLLDGAEQTKDAAKWKALLLGGLNLCMYMEELCELRWDELDFSAKTFVSNRGKTGVVRVATLWDETIAAFKALGRRGDSPYVFTSRLGTRYNKNALLNGFKEYREKLNVNAATFSHIRDGAYTVACQDAEEKFSRILAGHKFAGLTDNYVKRNPRFVKPACDAVYRHYFGVAPLRLAQTA